MRTQLAVLGSLALSSLYSFASADQFLVSDAPDFSQINTFADLTFNVSLPGGVATGWTVTNYKEYDVTNNRISLAKYIVQNTEFINATDTTYTYATDGDFINTTSMTYSTVDITDSTNDYTYLVTGFSSANATLNTTSTRT